MNFSISKRVFYNALQIVAKSVSSNSPIPALSGIKIEVNADSIILVGSDADISIMKTLKATDEDIRLIVKETGSIVIESKYILEIVRKIDADDIELQILDGCLTKISGGSSKFEINGIKANEYPTIDFAKPSQQFTIDADKLLKIINQTTFAASDKETRPVLTGVNFKCNGTTLECVATDSYRLARKTTELETESNFNITIPAKSLNEVSKIIEKDTNILVCVSDRKAQFWIENNLIQTRLIEGAYPETARLIPQNFDYELTIDSRDMLNAIDRASFIKNEGVSLIKLSMSDKECIISSRSQEVGSSLEKLNAISYNGQPLDISFSGRYAFEAIRVLSATTITIQFSGEMRPFIIRNEKDDSILQLVLPVRTYN